MSITGSALRVISGDDATVTLASPPVNAGPFVTIGGQVVGPAVGRSAESSSVPALTPEQVIIERISVGERLRGTARLRLRESCAALTGLSGQAQVGLLVAALALLTIVTVGIVRVYIARRDRC